MEQDFDEPDFETEEQISPEKAFSISILINGNKTDVVFNCCLKDSPNQYFAVNLLRNGSCVNSFTMVSSIHHVSKTKIWRFEEDSVPKELKSRELEFSTAIMSRKPAGS